MPPDDRRGRANRDLRSVLRREDLQEALRARHRGVFAERVHADVVHVPRARRDEQRRARRGALTAAVRKDVVRDDGVIGDEVERRAEFPCRALPRRTSDARRDARGAIRDLKWRRVFSEAIEKHNRDLARVQLIVIRPRELLIREALAVAGGETRGARHVERGAVPIRRDGDGLAPTVRDERREAGPGRARDPRDDVRINDVVVATKRALVCVRGVARRDARPAGATTLIGWTRREHVAFAVDDAVQIARARIVARAVATAVRDELRTVTAASVVARVTAERWMRSTRDRDRKTDDDEAAGYPETQRSRHATFYACYGPPDNAM